MAATDSLEPILIVLWIYSTSTRNFWAPIESPNVDQVQLQDGLKSIDKAQLSRARNLCITTVVLNAWGFVAIFHTAQYSITKGYDEGISGNRNGAVEGRSSGDTRGSKKERK
ncbi:hypothetical protein BofuT4_P159950.1 [Botrytis cinerea T4]|uniref:Uncharacterized protein n=1 Tax=Botryotinia fuckeliana (strain T4) TaxID=999810 RepID=G2YU76_BOTF4|nr:hypothetical protein BofuT4_P159950.1 [Botrytis cinerea T4]